MSDKWDLKSATACLRRNGLEIKGKQITLKRAGIKVWGAIDYLVRKHKFNFMKEEKDA